MPILRVSLILTALAFVARDPTAFAQAYAFEDGRWFDGESFVEKTMYTANGVLVAEPPEGTIDRIDLNDGYVVPPFGEAHNHNVDAGADAMIRRYLADGIFYVKNPNSLPNDKRSLVADSRINTQASIDVIFANGGLTSTKGHPIQIANRNIDNGYWDEENGEGGFYHTIDSEADLDAKWPGILAGKPDFIKTYLLYSEEFEKRKADSQYDYWKGLDPALLPTIVARAHEAGLRVSTHIETAADFRNAVAAGVDEINHLPGFRPQEGVALSVYALTETDAADAAEAGVRVVTTLFGIHKPEIRELHARNLRLLKDHGVAIAIGSDAHRYTSTMEANYLRRLEVFSNLELLKMWCETTAASIFPDRKIGKLADGYEASFLVLEGNPIEDFGNTRKIAMRVKQGVILDVDPS